MLTTLRNLDWSVAPVLIGLVLVTGLALVSAVVFAGDGPTGRLVRILDTLPGFGTSRSCNCRGPEPGAEVTQHPDAD